MKDISTNIIEIDGKEYTLFLNRKGLVAYEKYCQEEAKKVNEFKNKYKDLIEIADAEESVEIKDDEDPFKDLDGFDDIEEDAKIIERMYIKLYWIMLYTNHSLSLKDVEKLFNKAVETYGVTQMYELADQMVKDINTNPYEDEGKDLKKLEALKPKK